MKIIRVFPRRTTATPTDELTVVNRGPSLFDTADEVHISVAFTWDIPRAEWLEKQWRHVAPTKVGGPAMNDPGGEFVSGRYLKPGYVITSRGCPNSCWFCQAWRKEGHEVRELPIVEGWNLLDNNIFACSREHQESVFEMLLDQKRRPMFTGGLEAARLTDWHVKWFMKLKPKTAYFAYDEPKDREPLYRASGKLHDAGLLPDPGHSWCCYVLIGYKHDSFASAGQRLKETVRLGFFPQAMLFDRRPDKEWRRFQREWANKVIVGAKMKEHP
jgi:hypothetical protein